MFLTIKLCTHTELFEIELFIGIKMDLALNDLQMLICRKIKKQKTNSVYLILRRDQCFLLVVPGYAAKFQLELVYFEEVLDHLRTTTLYQTSNQGMNK